MVACCLLPSLPIPYSCCMSVTVARICLLSLTIFHGPIELQNVSHCHLLLLVVSQLHVTGREIKRQPANQRRQLETCSNFIGPARQWKTSSNHRRQWETCTNFMGSEWQLVTASNHRWQQETCSTSIAKERQLKEASNHGRQ